MITFGALVSGSGPVVTGYYGSFYDITQQNALSTTQAYVMNIGHVDTALGISLANGNQVVFEHSGLYSFQYDVQFANSDTGTTNRANVDVWLRKNGVDVPNSNSIYTVNRSIGGIDGQTVAGMDYVLPLAAGDYLQLCWAVSFTTIYMAAPGPQVNPTVPQTTSLNISAHQIG